MNEKIYQTFSFSGKSVNCYGLEIVKNNLLKYGYNFEEFTTDNNNTVLFSLYWPEQIYNFIKFRYGFGMKDKKIIVGGNTATVNPGIITSFDSSVFVGDGEQWDGSIDSEHIINPEEDKIVDIAHTKLISPVLYEDVQSNRRTFCEMSRGCKNKCLFCQYGWLKKYVECDITDIKEVIKKSKTKSIRMFAADRFQHSKYLDIRKCLDNAGKCDTGSDVSFKFVLKNKEYLKYTNKIRIGIEGMSERLRNLVGKPITNDEIIEFCKSVESAGIRCLDWYMIYGLPTEKNEDIDEFSELLHKISEVMTEGYCIALHWNAFTPSALTPFQYEKSAFGYDGRYIIEKIFSKTNKTRIKLMHKPKLTSDLTIIKRMLAIRGCKEVSKLMYNVAYKPGILKNFDFILKTFKDNTGFDLCGEVDCDTPLPWDKKVTYQKEKMINIVKKNKAKYG